MKNDTYFVDIDGTLVKYRPFSLMLSLDVEPIQDVIDKINSEFDKGSHIVITTARPEVLESYTKEELEKIGVKYHTLLMGIGRGKRYVINDVPEGTTETKAVGINIRRDKGFKDGTF